MNKENACGNTTKFEKYMDDVIHASNYGVIALNTVQNAAYIDYLHGNITCDELVEIRRFILNRIEDLWRWV